MRFTAAIAVLAASLVLAGPVAAQDAAQPAPATPEEDDFAPSHLALAQDIITLTESDVVFDDILPRLAVQTQQLFTRSNPALTREIEETVNEVALGMVQRRVELSHTVQLVWARRFTEPELEELKTFFASDVGKKFVEATPIISALSIGAAQQWEASLAAGMVEQVRAKMRDKGYAL